MSLGKEGFYTYMFDTEKNRKILARVSYHVKNEFELKMEILKWLKVRGISPIKMRGVFNERGHKVL